MNAAEAAVSKAFTPEVIEAQRKISEAYPHMTDNQVSYLAGYLDAMVSKKEAEEKRDER